ncbi:amidase [Herbaspirillum sp. RV1423]|uniref:amidase n=1 Tax=Herbaspirillum sp. RV1423 TaxID=1443993 RepID=UPI0004B0594F|nr:amidase [Herbaspirillum sp. RV1423]
MKTIRALAAELQAGQTTSVKLVEQALERIAAYRGQGGAAYVGVNVDRALAAAHASDAARAAGNVPSLLAGLPVSIKDLFDVQGEVTAAGSRVLANAPAAQSDAPAVARLRHAGAVLLGRTNMSEFAFSGLGLNPHYGTPRNPLDVQRVSGGSTSGGAVSVAAGMAVMALGTDTGGSIRIPSAFCGLTGFKPTARRVSLQGAVPLSTTLDSAGPLARSVDCCAIADAILSGATLETDAVPLAGLRFGVTEDVVADGMDDTVRMAFDAALSRLQSAGALIQRFAFPELKELPVINAGGGFSAAESWAWHRRLLDASADQYDQRVAVRIRRGAQQTAADYIDLLAARRRIIAQAKRRLSVFDAWLMPTVPVVPPLLQPLQDSDETFFAINGLVLRNPSVINFLDGCALNLPCPTHNGLPVGISICGLNGDDARILAISRAVEAILPAQQG